MTEERADKGQVIASFTILKCKTDVVETPDGKRHFESDCLDKKARDYFSSCFEEEAILRVNPKMVLEDAPAAEPPAEPAAEPAAPVTES